MRAIIEKILDLIYPQNLNCILCDMPISRNNRYSMCRKCFEKLIFINKACVLCGKPSLNLNLNENVELEGCGFCKNKRYLFERNISVLEYTQHSKNLVFELKYGLKTYLSKIIAQIMYDFICKRYNEIIPLYDYITFVPLSSKRYRKRGFNQSEDIARYFSAMCGIPFIETLKRTKNTQRLFRLSASERKKELLNSFRNIESAKNKIEGKNIIVIDDIFTTGTTMDEISKVLKLAGAEKIMSLTFLTGSYEAAIDDENKIIDKSSDADIQY